MSGTENRFRTTAFGGFHKQDVLDYITAVGREHQEQIAGLRQTAEQAHQEREEMAEKCAAAEAAQQESDAAYERQSAELEQNAATLKQVEQELSALKEEHEKAVTRLAGLEDKLPRLEADAAAYAALKDRMATIELEAHRKAQETVDQAQAQASKLRGELEGWLGRVQGSYQRIRTDIYATVSHLAGELERGKTALEEAGSVFQQHDADLNELLQCERVTPGVPAPELLPLEKEIEETKEKNTHG